MAELTWEMVVDILFGSDSHTVPGGRPEMPIMQNRNDFLIHSMPQPLKQLRFHYISLRINGDLHNHVTLHTAWKL